MVRGPSTGGKVVEITIRIELFAGEIAGVIACADLAADSAEDIVLVPDEDVLVVVS